jgi:hypothetical protein
MEPVPGEGAEPILRLDRLELSIGISSLWRRELVLSRILAQDLGLAIPAPRPDSAPFARPSERVPLGPLSVRITAIQDVVRRTRAAGRAPSVPIANAATARCHLDPGALFRYVSLASLHQLGAREFLSEFK